MGSQVTPYSAISRVPPGLWVRLHTGDVNLSRATQTQVLHWRFYQQLVNNVSVFLLRFPTGLGGFHQLIPSFPAVFLPSFPPGFGGFSSTFLPDSVINISVFFIIPKGLGSLLDWALSFPPPLPIRVRRFFTNALIFQSFLIIPPGIKRLSPLKIFRFSSSVLTEFGGFHQFVFWFSSTVFH